MIEDFEIIFVSANEYENLVAEILFKGQRLCQISMENGPDSLVIDFIYDKYIVNDEVVMKFSLDAFKEVVFRAQEELLLIRK